MFFGVWAQKDCCMDCVFRAICKNMKISFFPASISKMWLNDAALHNWSFSLFLEYSNSSLVFTGLFQCCKAVHFYSKGQTIQLNWTLTKLVIELCVLDENIILLFSLQKKLKTIVCDCPLYAKHSWGQNLVPLLTALTLRYGFIDYFALADLFLQFKSMLWENRW